MGLPSLMGQLIQVIIILLHVISDMEGCLLS